MRYPAVVYARTYVLTAALPAVAQDLTINGNGATLHRSAAAGTAAFTILTITAGTVTLNKLSFTNGNGAITLDNQAQLDVTGGVFSGNTAVNGAAINASNSDFHLGATVVQATGTTISGNHAGGDGGGIDYSTINGDGGVSLTDSTISGNHAGGRGGGLYNQASVVASGTQITGNRAVGGGGGICDDGTDATVTLTDSSPAGNKPDNCEPLGSITGCTG